MHSLKKGFSLIELLVVIAIIGILAAVGTTGYQVYIDSTKAAVVKNNAATLQKAIINEDMAQSAGVGGYPDCGDKTDFRACVRAILAASTLTNPYDQNARYEAWNLFGISQAFATSSEAPLANLVYAGYISGTPPEDCQYQGWIGLELMEHAENQAAMLKTFYCDGDMERKFLLKQSMKPGSDWVYPKLSFFLTPISIPAQ